jgi:S1-C subfamily serine protease
MKAVSHAVFRSSRLIALAALTAFLSWQGAAWAQEEKTPPKDKKPNQKSSDFVVAAFRTVTAKPSLSTVKVLCDGKDAALGTIVGSDGWILTKASEMKGLIACSLKDGRSYPAVVVGVDDTTDLAMLKINATGLPAVAWSESKVAPVGFWVASPGPEDDPVAIGVVSVAARKVPPSYNNPPAQNSGFLGITMDSFDSRVRITAVEAGSAAEKAGFKVNDVIFSVGGVTVRDEETYAAALEKAKADQELKVRVHRFENDEDLTLPDGTEALAGIKIQVGPPGAHIREVSRGSAAEKAGLKVKDVVISMGDQKIKDTNTMMDLLRRTKPDQEIKLKVLRDGKELELKATLGKRPANPFGGADRGEFQNRMGGALSERRGGFPVILQHDTVLKPTDCGGPLVDLDGNIIGINIARAGRTESYALPSETVQPLLVDLMSGKLAPKAQPASTMNAEQRIVAAKAHISKLQSQQTEVEKLLKSARATLAEAEATLEAQKQAEAKRKLEEAKKKEEEDKRKAEEAKRKKEEEKKKEQDKDKDKK